MKIQKMGVVLFHWNREYSEEKNQKMKASLQNLPFEYMTYFSNLKQMMPLAKKMLQKHKKSQVGEKKKLIQN